MLPYVPLRIAVLAAYATCRPDGLFLFVGKEPYEYKTDLHSEAVQWSVI